MNKGTVLIVTFNGAIIAIHLSTAITAVIKLLIREKAKWGIDATRYITSAGSKGISAAFTNGLKKKFIMAIVARQPRSDSERPGSDDNESIFDFNHIIRKTNIAFRF